MKRGEFLVALGGVAAVAGSPEPGFRGKRARTEYAHELTAPPEDVFPLLCPVREYDWLEGWTCEMIYSESGVAEENCVFRTDRAPHGLSTWYVTRYEPLREIEFVVVATDMATRLSIRLERTPAGTKLHWTRLFTGLTDAGNAHVGLWTVEKDRAICERLAHFLQARSGG
jgi:hypothetical protein